LTKHHKHNLQPGELFVYRYKDGGTAYRLLDGCLCVVVSVDSFTNGVEFHLHAHQTADATHYAREDEVESAYEVPM
jgi:hypothetical protein